MKTKPFLVSFLLLTGLAPAQAAQFGDFTCESSATGITITGYTGPGGAVTIPDTVHGLPVTSIGGYAFQDCTGLTRITVPGSVTAIGDGAFENCSGLTTVMLGNGLGRIGSLAFCGCVALTSVAIPETVTSVGGAAFLGCSGLLSVAVPGSVSSIAAIAWTPYAGPRGMFQGCASLTNVAILDGVKIIETCAFRDCVSLANITVPASVTNIGHYAFIGCAALVGFYFQGDSPPHRGAFTDSPGDSRSTVHYMSGTTGWGHELGGRPTAPWVRPEPMILDFGPSFGVQPNGFGFRISWATNANVVVEACTDLATPVWSPASTNTLTDGWVDFTDPDWAQYPARLYHVRGE